jgi:hypothetical protein
VTVDSGIGNEGGTGTEGTGGEVFSSSPVDTQGSQQVQDDPINPAWEPFLNELPEYFHPKAKTHFKTWDDNYNSLESKYKELEGKYQPYEQYLSVDPSTLQNAMVVFQNLNDNPQKVYEVLARQMQELGLIPPTQSDDQGEFLEEQTDPKYQELDQRTRQLDERQAQMDEFIQQQTYNAEVSTYEEQIDSQVQGVLEKYGNAVDTEDLMNRMMVQIQTKGTFDAEAAFNDQKATFQRLWKAQNGGRPAPTIIPTNGTPAPSLEKKPEEMNEDERKAYFKQLLDTYNGG